MKVLVTGGAGFIGSHIVEHLLQEGHQVVVVDNFSTGKITFLPKDISLYEMNIQSPNIESVFQTENPEVVIHLAAQVDVNLSIQDPVADVINNIMGTINLLNYCQKYKVRKLIYSSSCAVYGDATFNIESGITETFPISPLSFYGISKFVPELYLKLFHSFYGSDYTVLRYANVYGPRQGEKGEGGVVSIFCRKILKEEPPIIYGNGEQTRDFIFVKDVALANIRALTMGEQEIINISSDQSTSIINLYQLISEISTTQLSPFYQPSRDGDILHSKLNNSKAKRILHWQPAYSLEEGLKETWTYYEGLEDNTQK